MRKVKDELEDLAFKHLDPKSYETTRAWVERRRKATRKAVQGLRETLERTLAEAGVPFARIESRIKAALRHPSEDQAAAHPPSSRSTTSSRSGSSPRRSTTATRRSGSSTRRGRRCRAGSRTSSRCPRPTGTSRCTPRWSARAGCRSRCRSGPREMHEVAENGIAAHWKYKEGRVGVDPDEEHFAWLRQLLEFQQELGDPGEFIPRPQGQPLPGRGLHVHPPGARSRPCPAAPPPSTSPTASTPTSGTSAWGRG